MTENEFKDLKTGQERILDLISEESRKNQEQHELTQQLVNQAFQKIAWLYDLPARVDLLEKEIKELRAMVA